MFDIAISNHPIFDDIKRRVSLHGLTFNLKEIKITLRVNHYINDIHFKDMNKGVRLILNNSVKYPTGNGDETIGDFTYFTAQTESGVSLKALIEAGIATRDSEGIINTKCNYKDKPEEPVI